MSCRILAPVRPNWSRAEGFTLIEVLVALTILALGVLAVSTLQLNATRNSSVGDVIAMGLAVAESRVELLRTSNPGTDLVDGSDVDDACDADAGYDQITYAVDCAYATVCEQSPCPPGAQSRQFTVSVQSPVQRNPIVLTGKVAL